MPTLRKWPFLAGDVLLLCTAAFVVWQRRSPLTLWECVLCAVAVALGALLCVTPFVLEYRALMKLSETETLAGTLKQLQDLKAVASNISAATAQWQGVQDLSGQTVSTAKDIAAQMVAEAAAFRDFLKKANDSEKAMLQLEAEKLRRAQGDWLQVVVRMLDHAFALHQAAVRSGKPEVIAQIGSFQEACRDIVRRIGLVPFEAAPGEAFDAARHRPLDDQKAPPPDAQVCETIAVGYTFQGQPLRPALVNVKSPGATTGGETANRPPSPTQQPAEQSLL